MRTFVVSLTLAALALITPFASAPPSAPAPGHDGRP